VEDAGAGGGEEEEAAASAAGGNGSATSRREAAAAGGNVTTIVVGEVNCEEEPALAEAQGVGVYPAVKVVLFERALLYAGRLSVAALLAHVRRKAAPPVALLRDKAAALRFANGLGGEGQRAGQAGGTGEGEGEEEGAAAACRVVLFLLDPQGADTAVAEAAGLAAMGTAGTNPARFALAVTLDIAEHFGVAPPALALLTPAQGTASAAAAASGSSVAGVSARMSVLTDAAQLKDAAAISRFVDAHTSPPVLRLDSLLGAGGAAGTTKTAAAAAAAATKQQLLSAPRGVQLLLVTGGEAGGAEERRQVGALREAALLQRVQVLQGAARPVTFLTLRRASRLAVRFFGAEGLPTPALLVLNVSVAAVRRYLPDGRGETGAPRAQNVSVPLLRRVLRAFFDGRLRPWFKSAPVPKAAQLPRRHRKVLGVNGAGFGAAVTRSSAHFVLLHLYVPWDWRRKAVSAMLGRLAETLDEAGLLQQQQRMGGGGGGRGLFRVAQMDRVANDVPHPAVPVRGDSALLLFRTPRPPPRDRDASGASAAAAAAVAAAAADAAPLAVSLPHPPLLSGMLRALKDACRGVKASWRGKAGAPANGDVDGAPEQDAVRELARLEADALLAEEDAAEEEAQERAGQEEEAREKRDRANQEAEGQDPAEAAAAVAAASAARNPEGRALLRELRARTAAAPLKLRRIGVTFINALAVPVQLVYRGRVAATLPAGQRATVATFHSIRWVARTDAAAAAPAVAPFTQEFVVDRAKGVQQEVVISEAGAAKAQAQAKAKAEAKAKAKAKAEAEAVPIAGDDDVAGETRASSPGGSSGSSGGVPTIADFSEIDIGSAADLMRMGQQLSCALGRGGGVQAGGKGGCGAREAARLISLPSACARCEEAGVGADADDDVVCQSCLRMKGWLAKQKAQQGQPPRRGGRSNTADAVRQKRKQRKTKKSRK
jgi:hypothetical protein